ncbi:hypothetical protein [Synechococcus sp. Cu2B8-bc1011]|uniref:hypothetical protein n=1 Tax=Synechococcus sp. Cu2B8-bc1011 TaxID=3093725 RepID=UPI0039B02CDF
MTVTKTFNLTEIKPPKIAKEMLSRDYNSAKKEKGVRVESEGGHLTTTASFTTSAKEQDSNKEKRSERGGDADSFCLYDGVEVRRDDLPIK